MSDSFQPLKIIVGQIPFGQFPTVYVGQNQCPPQICPALLHTDREFEQLKKVLFAHVNAALRHMLGCWIYILLYIFFYSEPQDVFCVA